MNQDVLIDSNVYIDLLRSGRDPGQAIATRYDELDVVTCGMVQLEVLRGAREQNLKSHLQEVFSLMQYVPSDHALWEEANELAWTMDRLGKVIPAQDIVIAACALRVDAAVHSYDRHFSMIPGLTVNCDFL
ncbi:MAG: PIN domain-containing protein [Verrucomicrobiales bacterium]|nr:PIN domain-containing protein [Verrucomicrobiales bacterium]